MPIVTRHSTITVLVLAIAVLIGLGVFIWTGLYNIGADAAHTKPVYSMLQLMRERSIIARSRELHPPPNLNDAALIRQGAGNYDSMCTSCHLGPGMEGTELSKGLYPVPPNLSKEEIDNPAHQFWVIKHGIKASGMPAWGNSMKDEYIWGMVAFLQQLPKLSPEQYLAMVASSGGHSHGGGETKPHDEATSEDHSQIEGMDMDGMSMDGKPIDESKSHVDAPGAHNEKPAAQSKPHKDAPGAPPHRH